jgi:hypothetical protein
MRFFRSEETLRQWQTQHKLFEGEVLNLGQIWKLSQIWYGPRLDLEFHGRTVPQVEDIFRSLNLTSEFWYSSKLSESPDK